MSMSSCARRSSFNEVMFKVLTPSCRADSSPVISSSSSTPTALVLRSSSLLLGSRSRGGSTSCGSGCSLIECRSASTCFVYMSMWRCKDAMSPLASTIAFGHPSSWTAPSPRSFRNNGPWPPSACQFAIRSACAFLRSSQVLHDGTESDEDLFLDCTAVPFRNPLSTFCSRLSPSPCEFNASSAFSSGSSPRGIGLCNRCASASASSSNVFRHASTSSSVIPLTGHVLSLWTCISSARNCLANSNKSV
mmetsp:Transcript_32238/g.73723  ORF Transcript_32238/g.73723 Transcript_32238/m.73723 type:complete len:248 (-) Transcript_32238:15-758(-)